MLGDTATLVTLPKCLACLHNNLYWCDRWSSFTLQPDPAEDEFRYVPNKIVRLLEEEKEHIKAGGAKKRSAELQWFHEKHMASMKKKKWGANKTIDIQNK